MSPTPQQDSPSAVKEFGASGAPSQLSSTLAKLMSDVDDREIAERFVCDYVGLLDQRLTGLRQLLAATDTDAAVISLLSLETTSAMIGADEVVGIAHGLRVAVADGDWSCADGLFADLLKAVATLRRSLAVVTDSAADDVTSQPVLVTGD